MVYRFYCTNNNNRYFHRLAKVHAYIIHALRKDMPAVFGKESKKKELIKNLDQLYGQLQREHQVIPSVNKLNMLFNVGHAVLQIPTLFVKT